MGGAYELSAQGISGSQIKKALSLWDNGRGTDSFVSSVATTLLTEHEAWLEVVFTPDDRDGLPFRPVLVHGVRKTTNGNLIQEIPTAESPGSPNYPHLETVELDDKCMVHVYLPEKYPSGLLKRLVEDLVEVDVNDNLMPQWAMEKMTGQRRNTPAFDFSEATRTQRLRILQATLPIGWAAREIYYGENRNLGDYYFYWRELRFLHFRSSMRERAEKALQQVLAIAGERCDFKARVTARGLYTPTEVEEVIKRYEAGDIPLSAVNDIIFENANGTQISERILL